MAIEGDRRDLNPNADFGGAVDLSQSFAPTGERSALNQVQLNQQEVIDQMKQDLGLLSESLLIMREKFKLVADLVNQQPIEETEPTVDSSVKREKSLADLLDDYALGMRDAMIEVMGESIGKSGVLDLMEAVREVDDAIQTTIRVQELAESLSKKAPNHKAYDELTEIFKDALVSPEDKFPHNSICLRSNGIENYGDIVQYSLKELRLLTPSGRSQILGIGHALKYQNQLKLVGLNLRDES